MTDKKNIVDKGELLFEEDEIAFNERTSTGRFIFYSMVPVLAFLVLLIIYVFLWQTDPGPFEFVMCSLVFIMCVGRMMQLWFAVNNHQPIKFYANGIEAGTKSMTVFRPYSDFNNITSKKSLFFGDVYSFRIKGRWKGTVPVPRNIRKLDIYLPGIKEKIEANRVASSPS